jgi:cell division protein FtsL
VRKAERKQERAAAARYQKQVVAEAKTAREVAKKEKEKHKKKQRQKEWLQLKLETNKRKKLQQLKKLSDYPKDLFYFSARG